LTYHECAWSWLPGAGPAGQVASIIFARYGTAAGVTVNTPLITEWSCAPAVMGQAVRAT
jgi:hypothetical protein